MLKKWFEIIFDHRISLRERMFRVVTGVSMVALTIILLMGRSFANLLILAASLAFIAAIVKFSIRNERIHTGATAIAVLLLVVFPISFFTAGGFYSGMPEWFVLCFIYISITGFYGTEYGGPFLFRFRLFRHYGGCANQYTSPVSHQTL